jgi:acetate kinase
MTTNEPFSLKLESARPERILAINCGSSSLKYSFYDTADESRHARGLVERIGAAGTRHVYRGPKGETQHDLPPSGLDEAFTAMREALTAPQTGVISRAGEISAVVHRVVHGGDRFTGAALITDEVAAQIESFKLLVPLHYAVNAAGIRAMRRFFPTAAQVAVFDTAFHHTLPPFAYLYGLPYAYYEKKRVRRYGFHGISHAYASLRAAGFVGRRLGELKVVTCHLGNGSSLCAVDRGRSVDTTMGFTPCEGLIMGTRCGDIDTGVLTFLERTEGLTAAQSDQLLNHRSGLLGLSGLSSDLREILKAADAGNQRASLALETYGYRIRKYIGAYFAALGGLDIVVFTGGIGQGSDRVRTLALQGLACLGIQLDESLNRTARGFDEVCRISADDSKVTALVVPADEERMMAHEALPVLNRPRLAREPASQPPKPSAAKLPTGTPEFHRKNPPRKSKRTRPTRP